jgi:carbohydrate kinase (thermoresistant glucokinase family)
MKQRYGLFSSAGGRDLRFVRFFVSLMRALVIYIIGVSGSGKTTVGKKLSAKTGIPFFDGDDFHSSSNKKKMHEGQPLNDNDRKEWLRRINELAINQLKNKGAVIACSALKEKYRAVLSKGISDSVIWIFLQGSYELIRKRLDARTHHFMPPSLLASQFQALEVPSDALNIDVAIGPDQIVDMISDYLQIRNRDVGG